MPNWVEVLNEISGHPTPPAPLDLVRRKYLKLLHEKTGRNVISYNSGWLRNPLLLGTDINDMDMNAFMAVIHNLDCEKGLDLILHTPGGGISATEQIVFYLRKKFGNNIRAIVPQLAMSAGTMIACSCRSILMGKHSCLGPFDPQCQGVSAERVLEEFERAIKKSQENPASIPFWQTIIGKYHPTFLIDCDLATKRAKNIVLSWLRGNMFCGNPDAENISQNIVDRFYDIGKKEEHARHISIDDAKESGLVIEDLEDDQELQDLVLTIHHRGTLKNSVLCFCL